MSPVKSTNDNNVTEEEEIADPELQRLSRGRRSSAAAAATPPSQMATPSNLSLQLLAQIFALARRHHQAHVDLEPAASEQFSILSATLQAAVQQGMYVL